MKIIENIVDWLANNGLFISNEKYMKILNNRKIINNIKILTEIDNLSNIEKTVSVAACRDCKWYKEISNGKFSVHKCRRPIKTSNTEFNPITGTIKTTLVKYTDLDCVNERNHADYEACGIDAKYFIKKDI